MEGTSPRHYSSFGAMFGRLCAPSTELVGTTVPGFYLARNAVSAQMERSLLEAIDADNAPWTKRRTRVTKNYGPYYVYAEHDLPEGRIRFTDGIIRHAELPAYLQELVMPLVRETFDMLRDFQPNQMHVALYRKEASDRIRMHNDNKVGVLGPYIVGVSLGASCQMTFERPSDRKRIQVHLPKRSIYVMSGESHTTWRHGILNGDTTSDRVSITLRDVRELKIESGVQIRRSRRALHSSTAV